MTPKELRDRLAACGLSQTAAAAKLGVNRRTLYRWLTGDTPISRPVSVAIKAILRA